MAALDIRRYDPADADAIWELHVRALDDAGAYDEAFEHLDADLRAVTDEYLEAGGEFLVGEMRTGRPSSGGERRPAGAASGEMDGEIVAMGAFRPHDIREEAALIKRMRVDPAHQRRGFDTRIFGELERRTRDRGFDRAIFDTPPRQEAAIAFYESRGYRELRREMVRGHELIWYERSLDG